MQSNCILHAREKYDSYDLSCWTKVYFDDLSGGFNVYHKDHQFTKTQGGGKAEKLVGYLLAHCNGKQVEFLAEFYFGKAEKYKELRSAVDREVAKYQKTGELHKVPNIYYMDGGLLKLLWKK